MHFANAVLKTDCTTESICRNMAASGFCHGRRAPNCALCFFCHTGEEWPHTGPWTTQPSLCSLSKAKTQAHSEPLSALLLTALPEEAKEQPGNQGTKVPDFKQQLPVPSVSLKYSQVGPPKKLMWTNHPKALVCSHQQLLCQQLLGQPVHWDTSLQATASPTCLARLRALSLERSLLWQQGSLHDSRLPLLESQQAGA